MSQNQNKPEDMSDVFPEPENDDQMEQMEEIESGDDMMDAGQAGTASPEIQELKDKYLRLLAEFENYKRRTSKERIESSKFASQDMIASLLPVLDDFERESKYGLATEGSTLIHNKLEKVWWGGKVSALFRYNNEIFQRALSHQNQTDAGWLLDRL